MNKTYIFLQKNYVYIKNKLYLFLIFMIFLYTINNYYVFSEKLDDAEFNTLSSLVKENYERVVTSKSLTDEQFQVVKALIEKSETYRGNIKKDFVFSLDVQETVDKQIKNETNIKTYVHPINDARTRYVISQFLSGSKTNTLVLQREFNMWFFKPGTRNIIRISPSQRLLGGASYADVSNTNYNEYYDPIEIFLEPLGKVMAYKVVLAKKTKWCSL